MHRNRGFDRFWGACRCIIGAVAFVCLSAAAFAQTASLLPADFFAGVPEPGPGKAAIEADYLSQSGRGVIAANGRVKIAYKGYYGGADHLIFNQRTHDIELKGHVVLRDPDGNEYAADHVEITGNYKKAILHSMLMVSNKGELITASTTRYNRDGQTVLDNAVYAPCGNCVDEHGHRIGWRIRTKRIVYDPENELVDLDQPVLEVLGLPVAWLPWIRVPDPSNPRAAGFRLPDYTYGDKIGHMVTFPYFYPVGKDIDLWIEPSLMTRQGALLSATVTQRLSDWGQYSITGSGLYQLDRGAFSGEQGDRDWRGAIQISSQFTPTSEWTVRTSYSFLSDRAYLRDYHLPTRSSSTNEIDAQYLDDDTYGEIRAREYVLLGDATQADQDEQAVELPKGRFESTQDLPGDAGRVQVSATLLNASRSADSTVTANGVTYVEGYEENKSHISGQASWSRQWATGQGLLLTPYAGLRADFASYDGASALLPDARELYSLTPIAALDLRYPLAAVSGGNTHIIEPIAQLVYRGSDTTSVGITNDDAQSFVFDDSNLFSYNRFSGADRQETGLRLNVGGHYLADFADGSYLDLTAGQSFHLAGTNALAISDAAQTGTSTGLENTRSDFVAGLRGGFNQYVAFGGKIRLDPDEMKVMRASVGGAFAYEGWQLSLDYAYAAADPALGALSDQQDLGGSIRVPLWEYWSATAAAGYDLTSNELLDHSAALTYDDGYFSITGKYTAEGAELFNPASQTYKISFKLKTPGGSGYGL